MKMKKKFDMKKIKSITYSAVCALAVLGIVGAISTAFFVAEQEAEKEPEVLPVIYDIDYYAVHDKKTITTIEEELFSDDFYYPPFYIAGEETVIPDLEEIIFVGEYEDRVFHGWYLDSGCSVPFDGVINEDERGNFILYADISVGHWTGFY